MGQEIRTAGVGGALNRTVPIPDNICCPTCRVGETTTGIPIYMHLIGKTGNQFMNSLVALLGPNIITASDNTFSGYLPLYENYVTPSTDLIEIGSFSGGSDLNNVVKMAEKLFYYNSALVEGFLNNVLGLGIVTFCIGEDRYVADAERALELLEDQSKTILDEEIDCYLGTSST
jgi:hypothetical protein